jgi:prophage regulatory protein
MSIHESAATDAGQRARNRKRPLAYNPVSEIVRNEHTPIVTGLSLATIWRLRRDGKFPPAIRLGENSVGFRRSDLNAWLDTRTQK